MSGQYVAAAYDAIAPDYDRQLAGDEWMRRVLWSYYDRLFRPGDSVLDVSCGTGTDALHLAGRGVHVTAIDVSPGMIDQLQTRLAQCWLAGSIDGRVMDMAEIGSFLPESFDGVISAFAGLSTTPDLAPFAADAAHLLRPGGRMVVHMLNRTSLWEWLGLAKRGEWAAARRLGGSGERDFVIGGQVIRHHLHYPEEAYARFFARDFALRDARGLGCLRPPHTVRRVPGPVVRALERIEGVASRHWPLLNWGRFFVLELERRQDLDPFRSAGPPTDS
jgi:SAM-dependent methyltransferase